MQSELCIIWDLLQSTSQQHDFFFSPQCMSELFYNHSVLSATLTVLHFLFLYLFFLSEEEISRKTRQRPSSCLLDIFLINNQAGVGTGLMYSAEGGK